MIDLRQQAHRIIDDAIVEYGNEYVPVQDPVQALVYSLISLASYLSLTDTYLTEVTF